MAGIRDWAITVTAGLTISIVVGGVLMRTSMSVAQNEVVHIKLEQTRQATAIEQIPDIKSDVRLILEAVERIEETQKELKAVDTRNDERYHHTHR